MTFNMNVRYKKQDIIFIIRTNINSFPHNEILYSI